jgi:hypothetical protein
MLVRSVYPLPYLLLVPCGCLNIVCYKYTLPLPIVNLFATNKALLGVSNSCCFLLCVSAYSTTELFKINYPTHTNLPRFTFLQRVCQFFKKCQLSFCFTKKPDIHCLQNISNWGVFSFKPLFCPSPDVINLWAIEYGTVNTAPPPPQTTKPRN